MEGTERGAVLEGPEQTLAPKAHGRRWRSKKPLLGDIHDFVRGPRVPAPDWK